MKTTLLLSFCLPFLVPSHSNAAPLLQPADRVAICGDSSTASIGYSAHIENYLLACGPIKGIDVEEFGWSAATAKDFNTRLDKDLLPFKPTVVMTCFGMNDGGYKALDAGVATTYRQAQTDLVEAFKKAGVRTIIIGSPWCVDPLTFNNDPGQAVIYNKTLAALAEIDRDVAAKERVVYADVFGDTLAAMTAAKATYGPRYVFGVPNREHPSDLCSVVAAYAFLKALRFTGDIGTITADYKGSTAVGSPGHKIVSFVDHTLTVESTRYPFCFIDLPNEGTLQDPFFQRLPFNQDLNRLLLIVKNLPTGRAKLIWHDQMNDSHDFTAAELAKGINLATEYRDSPFWGRFQNVAGGVFDQQIQERVSGSSFVASNVKDVPGEARRNASFQKAAVAVVPVTHTLRIQPLAPEEKRPPGPVTVIVDTDMSGDCDDAGAVALLNSFMNGGEAKLIACVVNGRDADLSSGAVVQAINAYYGHPAIPIGANHGDAWIGPTGSAYTLQVHQHFNPGFPTDDKLPAGVDVYRKALASAHNGSVVIASIGLMENLQALLESKPDAISPLSGLDLIRKKVRELVIMANTNRHDGSVINTWPTKILFTTDVGSVIYTGTSLKSTPETNPVRFIYNLFGAHDGHTALANGRQSWDLTAAWLAVRGPGALWDVTWGGYRKVDPVTGASPWVDGPPTNQAYILPRMPIPEVTKLIETELSRPPKP